MFEVQSDNAGAFVIGYVDPASWRCYWLQEYHCTSVVEAESVIITDLSNPHTVARVTAPSMLLDAEV